MAAIVAGRPPLTACFAAALVLSGCAGSGATTTGLRRHAEGRKPGAAYSKQPAARRPAPLPYARVLAGARATGATGFVPVGQWQGHTVAWVARTSSGTALLSLNQQLLELALHSGTIDAGTSGWHYGPTIGGAERRHLFAAFNGGFKFDTGAGAFMSYGRVAIALRDGLGSIVTYTDGYTDVGAWHREVPAPGRRVASVRQNLSLLIDHGRAAATVACLTCWGATLGGVADPARSALGVTADGRLIWAGGEHVTTADLANSLLQAHVVRAVELDINPEWVAAYLYAHGSHRRLAALPVVPGQPGVPGQFLTPYSRDFFTVLTR